MKVAIVVYSQTGHTLSVAEKLREKLGAMGKEADILKLETEGKDGRLKEPPALEGYERAVFCAPVHAFSLAPVMKRYLEGLNEGKKIKAGCFVTQSFPFPWLGGTRAVRKMLRLCEAKGMTVNKTGIIGWSAKQRDSQIADVTGAMCKL